MRLIRSFFTIICILLNLFCSTLLPIEKRNYVEDVMIGKNQTTTDWILLKKRRFGMALFVDEVSENEFRLKYYSARKFPFGVYLACTFTIARSQVDTFKISNMSYVLDNGCSKSNQTDWCYQSRGVIGPASEKENEEYMLPCVREFLNDFRSPMRNGAL
ncbi:hypothetical protein CH379_010855 [Leptospira ellisii]|uniref:Uncharacterized protein n=1 Tax=Leptospira ellisii TaxID=2023197 RepID=A0A2N0BMN8_9LEPT|nr:hypothetical protein [Leptospira ellisii]MDV6236121.1 hypothetical protein [Leptospira ellisii]PJZ92109.1 hypothetical protein CH379_14940 [Leptospira ellisii]PKA05276.1 hypothetical protein CH375_06095 [Leptospira ellisii]